MDDFKKFLGKSLAKNNIASVGRGAFLNSIFQRFLLEKMNINKKVEGKIQNNVYCVKISNSAFSHALFLQKKSILIQMNDSLVNMNFNEIKDIKFI